MGWLSFRLAFPSLGCFLYDRHASAVHLHIQDGNRLAHHDWQIQLYGALNLLPLTLRDVLADGFGSALYRFGGHLQTGQHLHLFAAMIAGRLLPNQSLHAPHAGREVRVLDIQFGVDGELALMAMRTEIPGARDFHLAQCGEDAPRAEFAVTRLTAAGTWNRALLLDRLGEPQSPGERSGPSLMQGSAHRYFHRLQICFAGLLALGENTREQGGYFARALALDGFGRFFSSGVGVSSTGRKAQIFSRVSISSPQSR